MRLLHLFQRVKALRLHLKRIGQFLRPRLKPEPWRENRSAGNVIDLDFYRRYGTPAQNRAFLERTIFYTRKC